jgi:hypothetical protein
LRILWLGRGCSEVLTMHRSVMLVAKLRVAR